MYVTLPLVGLAIVSALTGFVSSLFAGWPKRKLLAAFGLIESSFIFGASAVVANGLYATHGLEIFRILIVAVVIAFVTFGFGLLLADAFRMKVTAP